MKKLSLEISEDFAQLLKDVDNIIGEKETLLTFIKQIKKGNSIPQFHDGCNTAKKGNYCRFCTYYKEEEGKRYCTNGLELWNKESILTLLNVILTVYEGSKLSIDVENNFQKLISNTDIYEFVHADEIGLSKESISIVNQLYYEIANR
jgi:hypothetical protein